VTDPQLTTRRILELMQELQKLADTRAAEEQRIASTREEELAAAEKEHTRTANKLTKDFADRRRALENEFAEAKLAAGQELRDSKQQITKELVAEQDRINSDHKQLIIAIERKNKEKQWEALAVFDATKNAPAQSLELALKRINARKMQVDGLERDAVTLLTMRGLSKLTDTPPKWHEDNSISPTPATSEDWYQLRLGELHHAVVAMNEQKLPPMLLEGHRVFILAVVTIIAMIVPSMFITGFSPLWTAISAVAMGSVVAGISYLILRPKAIKQTIHQYEHIRALIQSAREFDLKSRQEANGRSQQESKEINDRKDSEINAAQTQRDKSLGEGNIKQLELLNASEQRATVRQAESEFRQEETLAAIQEKYPPLLDQLAKDRQLQWEANEITYATRTTEANTTYDADWQAMAEDWHRGFKRITDELASMQAACDRLFPDWSSTQWQDWERPGVVPPMIEFGECTLPLQAVKNAVSQESRLVPEQKSLQLPAWLSLEEHPRMVITADGPGRHAAAEILQMMMFRFLTAIPAGKLRFTIVDPAALGQNFATFMHLADHDEQLVGKRIWTDSRQIEERLALISDHMEKVLQKYLRNEFTSIHDYNAFAGEVSEPYHVLVVANFPTGLSDNAMRRLKTIATTGPRCGVYTLISIDKSVKLPADFPLTDLMTNAVHLDWLNDRFRWQYPLFSKLELQLEKLPPKDKLNEILRYAGEESRVASRVEVPFNVVAPRPEKVWSESSASELVVPIGRAGANELQAVRLGKGTAQHALISGKTGSGKSTLLHALVTNFALRYSPREVEFYLVDFKKGVEFKTYATHQLPHARVIAIESEREFGVSVLERLDEILRQRGEKFRALGVQDLASYRSESGETMPRILLVVDEFQELFVSDDKLAQDAALLLDRLVRQGRAFGMHVMLGSQTLAGAYSLARSTIGQMAVRIALECSEADAHLILSDDNSAARLLSRPGEAIYNDQNGMVEGNHLFQTVWLPDRERQQHLFNIRERQTAEDLVVEPAIVFEGNVPANPLQNEDLVKLVAEPSETRVIEPTVWLGSAVRIEPATQMTFRRQGGNNLLIVGQDEPLALGVLSTAAAALAAQSITDSPHVFVLDGMRSESADRDAWQRMAAAVPGKLTVHTTRETGKLIGQLAAEVSRRAEQPEEEYDPQFLIVYDLAQLRDLRLTEEDFSFSSMSTNGKPPSVDKQFREILREGPAVGVHVLIWCDSHNSLMRVFDRLTMREVDFRVALQMSPVDSTSLIDSPAAGRLGEHRALFYRDDTGTSTKFRPYGRPTPEWLAFLAENLSAELKAE
jgi:S-DNA-T family DNA segregation ATPase FtsK/SpoIIIE